MECLVSIYNTVTTDTTDTTDTTYGVQIIRHLSAIRIDSTEALGAGNVMWNYTHAHAHVYVSAYACPETRAIPLHLFTSAE